MFLKSIRGMINHTVGIDRLKLDMLDDIRIVKCKTIAIRSCI